MTIQTYGALLSNLPDNTTGDISPQDIRDVVETFATKYVVCTYDPGSTVATTANTWVRMPIAKFGSAGTSDITVTSNIVYFTTPGLYICIYRQTGVFATSAITRLKLRYDAAGTPIDLPYSQVSLESSGSDEFTLTGTYLLNVPSGGANIDLQYQTAANESWQTPKGFITAISLPVKYGS